MELKGKIWKFGDNVDTDAISRAVPEHIRPGGAGKALHGGCFPSFPAKVKAGDIIVAGANFGCGSSREHAPIAIKAAGVACVIAKSFARIFYRNSFNTGLPILECPEAFDSIGEGDEVAVSLGSGEIRILKDGRKLNAQPVPEFMQVLLKEGGLMNYVEKGGL